ncbi:hypothetical protein TSOC_013788, partial [Tetrabaena socialis]
ASGSVRLALRHCLTSSFGSVAFAAAVLAVLRAVRRVMEDAARRNVICCIINCIVQPMLALAEQFTRFATIAAAITGDAFVPAAKTVFGTLKRNLLQTYSLWCACRRALHTWVPDAVLHVAVLLMSLTWSGIVFFATYAANKKLEGVWGIAFAVAAVSFLCMYYVLLFVAGLLLDVVNTLYICYALDKDQRRCTHPEIHALYNQAGRPVALQAGRGRYSGERQHQVLLEAVLPKEMIKQLKEEDSAAYMKPRILPADTPADVLLGMMRELMDGTMPDLRDVVFIRTALMRNMDVYRPLNLKNYLRGSSLDNDVVRALMRQLGTGRENEDGGSNYGGGDDGCRELDSIDDDCDGDGIDSSASPCVTVSATLQLIMTTQPHTLRVGSETYSVDESAPLDGEREPPMEPSSERAGSGRELRGGGTGSGNSRWRSRKSGAAVQVVVSGNARSSSSSAPPPLVLQASVVEE